MDYVKECLECGEPVDFVTYLKHQDIEKRHIFNRHFQNTLEKMTSSSNNTGADEQLREWAQEIIDNNFEILDRTQVIEYWCKVEEKKFKANTKYHILVQLNAKAKLEGQIVSDMFNNDDERIVTKLNRRSNKRQKN